MKYLVKYGLRYNGKRYKPGDKVELPKKVAGDLMKVKPPIIEPIVEPVKDDPDDFKQDKEKAK